jgi:TonB family protein
VGTVRNLSGAPVEGASVQVKPSFHTVTDAHGAFTLHGLPVGVIDLQVRRLGFTQLVTEWELGADTLTVALQLHPNPTMLPTVQVKAQHAPYAARLAGFYDRLKSGTGYYITRDQLERNSGQKLSEALARLPGVSRYRLPGAGEGVRLAGQNCPPLVMIDGFPASTSDRGFDIDILDPSAVEGVEVYRSSLSAPSTLSGPFGSEHCGLIAIWSRPMRPAVRANRLPSENTVNLDSLLQARAVYTMGTVDVPAEYQTGSGQPQYPDSLFRAGISGTVVAQFVVDAVGQVEDGTVQIVSTTHPQFGDAVRAALPHARFKPARVDGRAVREMVKMPFDFRPQVEDSTGRSGGASAGSSGSL